jgi:hypothetical protein
MTTLDWETGQIMIGALSLGVWHMLTVENRIVEKPDAATE